MAKAKPKTAKTTTTKKATAKKTTTKAKPKTATKKATAQRSKPIAQAKAKPKATKAKPKTTTKKLSASGRDAVLRRPDPNLPPSVERVNAISEELLDLITYLEGYAANLRALDRQRHNGVGLRRLGFIEAALRLSTKFPQYFPHWLNCQKAEGFLARSLHIAQTPHIYSWSFAKGKTPKLSGTAGQQDSAESIYNELHGFFRNMGPHETGLGEAAPTQKKVKRDVDTL